MNLVLARPPSQLLVKKEEEETGDETDQNSNP